MDRNPTRNNMDNGKNNRRNGPTVNIQRGKKQPPQTARDHTIRAIGLQTLSRHANKNAAEHRAAGIQTLDPEKYNTRITSEDKSIGQQYGTAAALSIGIDTTRPRLTITNTRTLSLITACIRDGKTAEQTAAHLINTTRTDADGQTVPLVNFPEQKTTTERLQMLILSYQEMKTIRKTAPRAALTIGGKLQTYTPQEKTTAANAPTQTAKERRDAKRRLSRTNAAATSAAALALTLTVKPAKTGPETTDAVKTTPEQSTKTTQTRAAKRSAKTARTRALEALAAAAPKLSPEQPAPATSAQQ